MKMLPGGMETGAIIHIIISVGLCEMGCGVVCMTFDLLSWEEG